MVKLAQEAARVVRQGENPAKEAKNDEKGISYSVYGGTDRATDFLHGQCVVSRES